jgi:hypothetical protein
VDSASTGREEQAGAADDFPRAETFQVVHSNASPSPSTTPAGGSSSRSASAGSRRPPPNWPPARGRRGSCRSAAACGLVGISAARVGSIDRSSQRRFPSVPHEPFQATGIFQQARRRDSGPFYRVRGAHLCLGGEVP